MHGRETAAENPLNKYKDEINSLAKKLAQDQENEALRCWLGSHLEESHRGKGLPLERLTLNTLRELHVEVEQIGMESALKHLNVFMAVEEASVQQKSGARR